LIYTVLKYHQGKPTWTINIYLIFKNEGQEGKIYLFGGGHQWEGSRHKERGNEGEYTGCVLYSHMKIKE
jgi:hypothetical protein